MKSLEKDWDFGPDCEESKEEIKFSSNLTLDLIDGDIMLLISVFKSGSVAVSFVLDKIEEKLEVLKLVNEINSNQVWFRASVDEYLRLEHNVLFAVTEANVAEIIDYCIVHFRDESIMKSLVPLSKLTFE